MARPIDLHGRLDRLHAALQAHEDAITQEAIRLAAEREQRARDASALLQAEAHAAAQTADA